MIIAFDLATTTGVAAGEPGATPHAWSFKMEGGHPERFAELMRITNRLIKSRKPTHIVIEAPFMGSRPDVCRVLMGLRGVVMGIAAVHGIDVQERQIAAVRKHFLGHSGGKGPAAKKLVMERCRQLGWPVHSDDEADALAVWDMRASEISPEHGRSTMRIMDGKK